MNIGGAFGTADVSSKGIFMVTIKSKSEIENMKNFGYKVIYDCGNLVYKMTIKKEIS